MKAKISMALIFALIMGSAAVITASEHWWEPPPDETILAAVKVEKVYQRKCSRCHPISRPDKAVKTPREWEKTVNSMRRMDPAWISADDARNIKTWLAGRGLYKAKCGECHQLDRSSVKMTVPQWKSVMQRMHGKDPRLITFQEKDLIIFYLTDINLLEPEKP
jgi:cytochrome c2